MVPVIVLAGGKGKRLGGKRQKVLTRVGPAKAQMLYHVLNQFLHECLTDDPPCICLAVGHDAKSVMERVGPRWRVPVLYAHSESGTGDAVRVAVELIRASRLAPDPPRGYLVVNGDTLLPDFDYLRLLRGRALRKSLLVVLHAENSAGKGIISREGARARVRRFYPAKPWSQGPGLVSTGVLLLRDAHRNALDAGPSLERDVIPELVARDQLDAHVLGPDQPLLEINTPESLKAVRSYFAR